MKKTVLEELAESTLPPAEIMAKIKTEIKRLADKHKRLWATFPSEKAPDELSEKFGLTIALSGLTIHDRKCEGC